MKKLTKTSGSMILSYLFVDNAFCDIEGSYITYWEGYGLPEFKGELDQFKIMYPEKFQVLLDEKAIKAIS